MRDAATHSLFVRPNTLVSNIFIHLIDKFNISFSSCFQHPVKTYGYAFFFSLTGYFGISFVLALIKLFGALVAVTGQSLKSHIFSLFRKFEKLYNCFQHNSCFYSVCLIYINIYCDR